jgi:hypothetical protein
MTLRSPNESAASPLFGGIRLAAFRIVARSRTCFIKLSVRPLFAQGGRRTERTDKCISTEVSTCECPLRPITLQSLLCQQANEKAFVRTVA